MDPVDALRELGGVSRRRELLRQTSRKRLDRAVLRSEVTRTSRGVYRLAAADLALVRAAELRGVASHLSAATLHGWEVAFPATCPWITVPRNVGVSGEGDCFVFWADLSDEAGLVTSPVRTVTDCARRLEFGPALAVADSALRHGDVTREELVEAAAVVRGKGCRAGQARGGARVWPGRQSVRVDVAGDRDRGGDDGAAAGRPSGRPGGGGSSRRRRLRTAGRARGRFVAVPHRKGRACARLPAIHLARRTRRDRPEVHLAARRCTTPTLSAGALSR